MPKHLFNSNTVQWVHSFGRILPIHDMKSLFLQSIETILSSKQYNYKYGKIESNIILKPILLLGFSYGASILSKLYYEVESILISKFGYSSQLIHFISIASPPILHMKTLGLNNVNKYSDVASKRLSHLIPKLKRKDQLQKMYGVHVNDHYQQWIKKCENMYIADLDNNFLYLTDRELNYNIINNQQSRFIYCAQ